MCIFSCNISKCSFKFLIRYVNTTIVNLQHHNFSSFRCTVCLQSYGQVKELSVTMFPTACSLSKSTGYQHMDHQKAEYSHHLLHLCLLCGTRRTLQRSSSSLLYILKHHTLDFNKKKCPFPSSVTVIQNWKLNI